MTAAPDEPLAAASPTTEAGRAFIETVRKAVLDPAVATLIGVRGTAELVALVGLTFLEEVVPVIEREAASAAAATAPGIDVERLHRAIRAVWETGHSDLRSGLTTGTLQGPDGRLAAAIAEVYDRG